MLEVGIYVYSLAVRGILYVLLQGGLSEVNLTAVVARPQRVIFSPFPFVASSVTVLRTSGNADALVTSVGDSMLVNLELSTPMQESLT